MIQVNLAKYVPTLPEAYVQAVVNSADAVWTTVPESYREPVLIAYTETLRDVYIIGVPMAIIAVIGALFIKNSKMPTKAEEMAKIQALKEKAALEKEGGATAAAEAAEREANVAEGVSAVNPQPAQAVQGGVDAQVVLAQQEGKSAV
jgi:hypothetical protein